MNTKYVIVSRVMLNGKLAQSVRGIAYSTKLEAEKVANELRSMACNADREIFVEERSK
jgi:hypothetical protein